MMDVTLTRRELLAKVASFPLAALAMQTPQLSFSARISEVTSKYHNEVMKTPYVLSVLKGTTTRDQYRTQLIQRLAILEAVDDALMQKDGKSSSEIAKVYTDDERKIIGNLREDLKKMGAESIKSEALLPETRKFLEEIKVLAKENPIALLGVVGVYNGGLANGGPIIAAFMERAIPGAGVSYHRSYSKKQFQGFQARLDKIVVSPEMQDSIIKAVRKTYDLSIETNKLPMFSAPKQ